MARGTCALAQAKLADAERHLQAAADLGRDGQNLPIQGDCIIALADIALLQGNTQRARHLASDVAGCAASLGNRWMTASAGVIKARCEMSEGDVDKARSLCQGALAVQAEEGYQPDALLTLDVIADLCAQREMYQQAARIYGAVDAAARNLEMGRSPVGSLHRLHMHQVARALGRKALRELLAEGSRLSLRETIDYASRGKGARKRPQKGWESLTSTELAVVRLLTDGLTNSGIAEKMLIAPGTVKAHLSHIFTKTGVSRRAELAAMATRRLTDAPDPRER
jgi:DNA-binding CsgD family transcriptional regulator